MLTNNLNSDIYIAFYCNFNHKNACTNVLPDDENMMVETSRRHEFKKCAFCWLTIHNWI